MVDQRKLDRDGSRSGVRGQAALPDVVAVPWPIDKKAPE
jgi:hypothetical protein